VAELVVAELEWRGEQAYLTSLRDITERKNMEEGLRKRKIRRSLNIKRP